MAQKGKRRGWSYSAGKNATTTEPSSKVRVYHRPDLPGRIFMTRAWVKTPSDRPEETVLPEGMSTREAEALADSTAAERRLAILEGRTSAREKRSITVKGLLGKYHDWLESQDRSSKTFEDKLLCRKFWLAALGTAVVTELTTADVVRIAANARRRGGHTARWDRKRLEYLRAAVRWGSDEARLYDTYPLRGLKLPEYKPDTRELVYTPQEAMRLATPHPDVDWRVTLTASIICDTGRRIGAVLQIRRDDLVLVEGRLHVVFRAEFDKGRRTATVPVSEATALQIADALELSEVIESGCLIPEGRTGYTDPTFRPLNKHAATKALHRAEVTLEVASVLGRGWHGLKRRHVTTSWEEASGDAGLVGDVTGNVDAGLLRNTYRQVDTKRTTAHVDRVRRKLEEEADDEG